MPNDEGLMDCIVPAAGRSSRMGRWKPALPFGESTIIETVVAAALPVCKRVILVGGFRADELAAIFRGMPSVVFVENTNWSTGMFSSLRCAAGHIQTDRFFITPGDMPWITPAIYIALKNAPLADVVSPTFGGHRGHPVLLRRAVAEEMLRSDPATGVMREIIGRFLSINIPWDDDTILRDVDTPQEYA